MGLFFKGEKAMATSFQKVWKYRSKSAARANRSSYKTRVRRANRRKGRENVYADIDRLDSRIVGACRLNSRDIV